MLIQRNGTGRPAALDITNELTIINGIVYNTPIKRMIRQALLTLIDLVLTWWMNLLWIKIILSLIQKGFSDLNEILKLNTTPENWIIRSTENGIFRPIFFHVK